MIGGRPQLIKEYNRDILKNLISTKGPLTKPELAKMTALSLPTVNKIVDMLEEEGVVCQGPVVEGKIGRKAKTYVFNQNAGRILIFYYLNGHFIGVLADLAGNEIHRRVYAVSPDAVAEPLEVICQAIDQFQIDFSTIEIKGICIGIPGVVTNDQRIANIPSIPSWEGTNLKKIIEEKYGMPAFVENDVKLMTVGYYYDQLIDQYNDVTFVYVGNGLGSGIIINRKLYKGYSCFAGEFGYIPVSMGAGVRMDNHQYSPLEAEFKWLVHQINENSGEAKAEFLRIYFELLTKVLASYIAVLNPEVILLRAPEIDENTVVRVRDGLLHYVPETTLPFLVPVEDDSCGIQGAINFCLSNITSQIRLIDQKGV